MREGYRIKIEPFLHISLSISFYIYVYSPLQMRVQITCLTIVYLVPEAPCGLEVGLHSTRRMHQCNLWVKVACKLPAAKQTC